MEKLEKYLPLAGRILLGLIFLMSGFNKIPNWDQTAGYMASKGMPMVPFFLFMAIVFEIVGALSIMTGFKAKWGALLLIVFLIPATFIFHNFWVETDAMAKQMQMIMFMKNLSIMGGLLLVAAFGSGPLSVDKSNQ